MRRVVFKDVVKRVNINVDRHNTERLYYVGGEHIDSEELLVTKHGLIKGATIGFKFHFGFNPGHILFMSRNPHLRKASMATFEGICSDSTYVVETRDKNILLQEYLLLEMQSDRFWNWAEANKSGGVNYLINYKTLDTYEFNLPSIDEQKILAEKLWAAYEVKQSYLKMIDATDEMVKAQFIEMVGIGESSKKNVEKVQFGTYVNNMTKGPFGSDIKKSLYVPKSDDTYKVYIQVNAIDKDLSLGDYYISSKYFNEKMYKFEVNPGDYIITCDGTIGKYIQMPENIEKGIISASLLRLTLNNGLLPRFFEYLWDLYILPELTKEIRNTALKHLPSATKVGETQVPQIDITEQRFFSKIAEQADKSKAELRKSIDAIDKVIKSLINENL